jgi:thioredoxin 1
MPLSGVYLKPDVVVLCLTVLWAGGCIPTDHPSQTRSSNVIVLTDADFASKIDAHRGVCLVDFWAPWCLPCSIVSPTVEELADEYAGAVRVGKVDTDAQPQTMARFRIQALPTLIVFRDGRPVKRFVGVTPKDALKAAIDEARKP